MTLLSSFEDLAKQHLNDALSSDVSKQAFATGTWDEFRIRLAQATLAVLSPAAAATMSDFASSMRSAVGETFIVAPPIRESSEYAESSRLTCKGHTGPSQECSLVGAVDLLVVATRIQPEVDPTQEDLRSLEDAVDVHPVAATKARLDALVSDAFGGRRFDGLSIDERRGVLHKVSVQLEHHLRAELLVAWEVVLGHLDALDFRFRFRWDDHLPEIDLIEIDQRFVLGSAAVATVFVPAEIPKENAQ